MQMWEGEIGEEGSRETCPHYVHGIHTELCRTHDTQIEEDKAFGNGCWMGHRGTRRSQYINRRPWFYQLLKKGVGGEERRGGKGDGVWKTWGRKVNGIRQHARANLKCNHHWKNMRVYTFQTNEKERGILGFLWKYLKCLQTGLPLRAFFFLLNIG